jgi:hypothetical protein
VSARAGNVAVVARNGLHLVGFVGEGLIWVEPRAQSRFLSAMAAHMGMFEVKGHVLRVHG